MRCVCVMYMLVCTNTLCMCHVNIVHVYMCVSVCNIHTVRTYHLSSLYLYRIGTCTWVQVCVLCPYTVYMCLCWSVVVSLNHTTCTPPLRIRRAVVYFYLKATNFSGYKL